MWSKANIDILNVTNKKTLKETLGSVNIVFELLLMLKNRNYMELFDNGYLDAKNNKKLLDNIFLETDDVKKDNNFDGSNYYKITHDYDSDNDNNYKIDFYSKDNDSY